MDLAGFYSLVGVDGEHPADEVMGLLVELDVMAGVVCVVDFPVKLLVGVAFVGEVADQHDEHHNPQRPYIRSLAPILLLLHNFRCHVAGRPAKDLNLHKPNPTLVFF